MVRTFGFHPKNWVSTTHGAASILKIKNRASAETKVKKRTKFSSPAELPKEAKVEKSAKKSFSSFVLSSTRQTKSFLTMKNSWMRINFI